MTVAVASALALMAAVARVSAAVYYVDQRAPAAGDGASWATAYRSIDDAFDAVINAGDSAAEIRVGEGTYLPTRLTDPEDPTTATFTLPDGASLRGGYAGYGASAPNLRDSSQYPTIISGDLLGDDGPDFANREDDANVLVTAIDHTHPVVLEGLDLIGGQGAIENIGGDMSIADCRMLRQSGHVTTVLHRDGVLSMVGCRVQDCRDWDGYPVYGALWCSGESRVTVDRCVFSRNAGGAIEVGSSTVAVLTNSVVCNNFGYGAAVHSAGPLTMTNCAVIANTQRGIVPGLNYAAGLRTSGAVAINNCVFWGNHNQTGESEESQLSLYVDSGIDQIFSHNCVQGWTGTFGGDGNFGDDPLFVDMEGPDGALGTVDDNLRLRTDSPCIDAGSNLVDIDVSTPEIEPIPNADLRGGHRFIDDPNVEDSGEGDAPIVDVGPLEGGLPFFRFMPEAISVPEGGTAMVGVSLSDPPASPLTVTAEVPAAGPFLVQGGSTLEFSEANYDTPQPITIASTQDVGFVNDRGTLVLSASNFGSQRIALIQQDSSPTPDKIYVKKDATGNRTGLTWQDALPTIQGALDIVSAHPGVGEVWVAGGVFHPSSPRFPNSSRSVCFRIPSGLVIRGGFGGDETSPDERDLDANVTILSGDLNDDDQGAFDDPSRGENAFNVVCVIDAADEVQIDGFTIERGNANKPDPQTFNRSGAGVFVEDSVVVIKHCRVRNNFATIGAGLFLDASNAACDVAVQDCEFRENQVSDNGGAIENGEGILSVDSTMFEGNWARSEDSRGGAIHGYGEFQITESDFIDNAVSNVPAGYSAWGGAMFISGPLELAGCRFEGNYAYEGGAIVYGDDSATFQDTQFVDNDAEEEGGAVWMFRADSVRFEGCLFQGNRLIGDGYPTAAAISAGNVAPDIIDCNFINNRTLSGYSDDGTLYLRSSAGHHGVMRNCYFVNNDGAEFGVGEIDNYDIQDCRFVYNYGGGAGVMLATDTSFDSCRFLGNDGPGAAFHEGAGALILGNNSTMTNCLIAGNQGEIVGGVTCDGDAGVAIINCTLFGNSASSGPGGIRVKSGRPLIASTISWHSGDELAGNADVRFSRMDASVNGVGIVHSDPQFINARGPDGVYGTLDDDPHIAATSPCVNAGTNFVDGLPESDIDGHPRVVDCRVDIGAVESTVVDFTDCNGNGEDDDCEFVNGTVVDCNGNLQIDSCEMQDNPGLDANDNGILDSCESIVLRVDGRSPVSGDGSSWASPLNNLQGALDFARQHVGDVELWVAAGTYLPGTSNHPNVAFEVPDRVAIYGGFAGNETERNQRDVTVNETILSADYAGDDEFVDPCCDHDESTECIDPVCRQGVCESLPECCTEEWYSYCDISATSGPDEQCPVCHTHGDNGDRIVDLSFTSAATILDGFTIRGAHTELFAATAVRIVNGSPIVRNCRILDTRGTAVLLVQASPTFENCVVNDTSQPLFFLAEGYALLIDEGCDVTLRNCVVSENSTSGIQIRAGSRLRFDGGRVEENRSAIDLWQYARFEASNLVVAGNDTSAAIRAMSLGDVVLDHCTIAKNRAGGVALTEGGSLVAANSIFWDNRSYGISTESSQIYIAAHDGPTLDIRNCCIHHLNVLAGAGNIRRYPKFVDAQHSDFHLPLTSPCGDAGSAANSPLVVDHDLDGVPRPMGCEVDMGAYEIVTGEPMTGDFNGDGATNLADLDTFVQLLLAPTPLAHCVGDVDSDGALTALDIAAFVDRVVN